MKLFQVVVLIVRVRVEPGAECAKITYSMRVRIAQARVAPNVGYNKPFDPEGQGSDLNPVIRTNCMCSVKCAEAAWNSSGKWLHNWISCPSSRSKQIHEKLTRLIAPAHNIRGKVSMKTSIHGFTDNLWSHVCYFFIQTLPRILCAGL